MPLRVTILGSSSAVPNPGRYPSSQLLRIGTHDFLIDCGEGTQLRMSELKVKRSRIKAIFISHLHGDHVLGLPGLLSSFNMHQRTEKLWIYGPPGIKKLLETTLSLCEVRLGYMLVIREISSRDCDAIDSPFEGVDIWSFPLKHRIHTLGYLFKEHPPLRKLNLDMIEGHDLTYDQLRMLKEGMDVRTTENKTILSLDVTYPEETGNSYAYCSDTIYDESLLDYIRDVDVLYHESTYMESEAHLADTRMHSTAKQAGRMARLAGAQKLILGHYSARYHDLGALLLEAKTKFDNTVLANTGSIIEFPSQNDK